MDDMTKKCFCCGNELKENEQTCSKCGAVIPVEMNPVVYKHNKKASRRSSVVGLIVGFSVAKLFWAIGCPFIIGVLLGLGSTYLIDKHYKNKSQDNENTNEQILSEDFFDKQEKLDNTNSDEYSEILDQDNEELDDTNSDDDAEEPLINMVGDVVNKKTFAEYQKIMGGFFPDFLSPDEQLFKYQELKNRKARYKKLTADEESKLIFPLIFGNYDCEINLDKALAETNALLTRVLNEKPKDNCVRENELYMAWLHEYSVPQMLLGTIYAYKNEYVKSAYHFMLGLKTEQIITNMPYSDFIKYILRKLPKYVSGEAEYDGCGFSENNVMGSCGGTILIPENALRLIPEMEGKNGEVIVAIKGKNNIFGYLERIGSTYSETALTMVDIYETYIIDCDYNVKKVLFYFNGYFNIGQSKIKIANGFKLKSHSVFYNIAKIIEA